MKKKKIFRSIIIILAILFALLILFSVINKGKKTISQYEIEKVMVGDSIIKSSILTGSIEPRDLVLIKPQMSGIVSELLKQPGEYVEIGEIVAKISLIPDLGQVQNASSRVQSAKIQLEHAKESYEREKLLYEQNVSSKEQYENAKSTYLRAQIDLESAQEALEIAKSGSSSKTRTSNNTLVRATVSGLILEQPVKVGQSVIQANNFNEGTTIVSIADLNDLLFVGKINEGEVSKINIGSDVKIKVGALDGKEFPAKVEYVSPKGVETNGVVMFEVKAALMLTDNKEIRAGFSSNAEVVLDKKSNIMTIPEKCVNYEGSDAFVYILKSNKRKNQEFEKVPIKLGLSDGLKVEVISGLNGNEEIRGLEI